MFCFDKTLKYKTAWTKKHQESFLDIKNGMMDHVKLAIADFSDDAKPLVITCDASLTGCGYYLSQEVARRMARI